jgi:hypothetical protein
MSFEIIRRALVDGQLVAAFRSNPEATLLHLGINDPVERRDCLQILSLMDAGAAQQNVMGQKMQEQFFGTLEVAKEMKEGLKRTLEQIDSAYRSTMLMYQISFYMGVLLVVAAVVVAFMDREPLLSSVFGALGMIDLLAFFLLKPQERLQSSRASLAQIQAALYNWFIDSVNLNTMMTKYDQLGDLNSVAGVSESLMNHTDKTLEMLQKYCKLAEK